MARAPCPSAVIEKLKRKTPDTTIKKYALLLVPRMAVKRNQ